MLWCDADSLFNWSWKWRDRNVLRNGMDWNILDTNHQHLLIDSYDWHFPDKIFTFKMVLIENKRHQKRETIGPRSKFRAINSIQFLFFESVERFRKHLKQIDSLVDYQLRVKTCHSNLLTLLYNLITRLTATKITPINGTKKS